MTTSTLANTELFGVPAETWAAWGIWATLAVYSVIAYFALRQVREARSLRVEQSRPFVAVDAKFRSIALFLSVKNIGRTAAEDVRVQLDERLVSAHEQINKDLSFQDASLFAGSMPLMAPERELLFLLDRFPDRADSDLPMVITGSVSYKGTGAKKPYEERFEIDLSVWVGARLPDKGMPELVEAVEQLKAAVDTASSGYSAAHSAQAWIEPLRTRSGTSANEYLEHSLAEASTPAEPTFDVVDHRPLEHRSLRKAVASCIHRLRDRLASGDSD